MAWSGEGVWKSGGQSNGGAMGGLAGGLAGGPMVGSLGAHYGKYGSGAGTEISNKLGFGNRKEKDALAGAEKSRKEHYGYNQGIASGLDDVDDSYLSNTRDNMSDYRKGRDEQYWQIKGEIDDLREQSKKQATDARETYSNDIRPNQKQLMEQSMQNAGDAMSLQEAGNPNNQIHTAVRDMYDKRAQGVQKQGVADFGVLSSLGAQAAAGQMGNVPMTAGSMQNIYAANQGQAGEAFANAQRRVADIQDQGVDRGFAESDRQYARGERAQDRASQRIGEFEDSDYRQQDQQGRYRNEVGGYNDDLYGLGMGRVSDDYGLDQGYTDLNRDTQYGKAGRQTAIGDQYYTGQQQGFNNLAASEGAQQAGKMGFIGSAIGAGATAYAGGAGGAAAGGAAGGITRGIAANTNPSQAPGYGRGGRGGYQIPQGGGYNNNRTYVS